VISTGSSPTSGPLDDRTGNGPGARHRRAAPLQLEELFGSKSIFDFAELVKEYDPDRSQPATGRQVRCWEGSSYKGHGVDALAPRADEGRGRLRKASGSREQTLIRRCPNGETRLG
jgi:hypothetical protein